MIPKIELKIKEISEELADQPLNKKASDIDQMTSFLDRMRVQVDALAFDASQVTKFQESLNLERTNFEKLDIFKSEFKDIDSLWQSRKQWRNALAQWQDQHFQKLDTEQMAVTVEKLSKTANLLHKNLEGNEVGRVFKKDVDDYKGMVALLISLREPTLKEVHWVEIRKIIGVLKNGSLAFEALSDPKYTVEWIDKNGILAYKEKIGDIALRSLKEVELI